MQVLEANLQLIADRLGCSRENIIETLKKTLQEGEEAKMMLAKFDAILSDLQKKKVAT